MAQRPVTLADIVRGHVSLEIEGFDRLYFNGWAPALQTARPVAGGLDRGGVAFDPRAGGGRAPVRRREPDPVGRLPQGRPEAGGGPAVPGRRGEGRAVGGGGGRGGPG